MLPTVHLLNTVEDCQSYQKKWTIYYAFRTSDLLGIGIGIDHQVRANYLCQRVPGTRWLCWRRAGRRRQGGQERRRDFDGRAALHRVIISEIVGSSTVIYAIIMIFVRLHHDQGPSMMLCTWSPLLSSSVQQIFRKWTHFLFLYPKCLILWREQLRKRDLQNTSKLTEVLLPPDSAAII